MAMRLLDLFSGIGGFSYAAEILIGGYETIAFCEMDEFCQKVLKKHWPQVPIFDDVRTLDAARLGRIDIVTGGYPCQPFSQAGRRQGEEDERHLWPEMLRIIKSCQPRYVVAENVAGHVTMGLDQVLTDLEDQGYTTRPIIVPACAKNAPHRRDRVWIIGQLTANTSGLRGQNVSTSDKEITERSSENENVKSVNSCTSDTGSNVANSDSYGHERGWSKTRNQNTTRENTQSKWSANTKDIKRQGNDGLDSGESRVDGDLSGSSDRGTTISTDTTGVRGLSKDADNNQGISIQHKYQEDNDRTLVSQGQKGFQLSEHRGLAADQTIAENNTIRSGDDNNSIERMENKESNVADTDSIRCRGGSCKGCSDCKRQVFSTERKGREMGSEVEGCSQSHRGEETLANTSSKGSQRGLHRGQVQRRQTEQQYFGHTSTIREQPKERTETVVSKMGDVADGLSTGLLRHFDREPEHIPRVTTGEKDRAKKLKALGNSIVPQVAAEILLAIRVSEGEENGSN